MLIVGLLYYVKYYFGINIIYMTRYCFLKIGARLIKGGASYTTLNVISARLLFVVTHYCFREIRARYIKSGTSVIIAAF